MSDAPAPVPPEPVQPVAPPPAEPPPRPVLKPVRRAMLGWFWALPGVVLVIVAVLVYLSLARRGERILVHFNEGHGLKPGDAVRCRGITVGEVRAVELSNDEPGVDVVIDL